MLMPELKELAQAMGISGVSGMRKPDLLAAIRNRQGGQSAQPKPPQPQSGAGDAATAGKPAETMPAVVAVTERDSGDDRPAAAAPQAASEPAEQERAGAARGGADDRGANAGQAAQQAEDSGAGRRNQRDRGERQAGRGEQQERPNGQDQGDRQQTGDDRGDRQAGRDDRSDDGDRTDRNRRNRNRDRNRNRNGRDNRDGGGGRDNRDNRGDRPTAREPQISEDDVLIPVAGILDILDNYAFVRTTGYLPGPNDVYVSMSMVKRHRLRKGDALTGAIKQPEDNQGAGGRREKFNPLARIDTVNGTPVDQLGERADFGKLTPLYPQHRLRLETDGANMTTRIIDLVAPIGKGQRGLIVSPPKAGKTMVLQSIANAITTNNPECHLMVVLVDERPEEVTDMQRSVKGEVIASTFDRPAEDHTTVAELAIERAKRLVELGHDVVVLLDSMTRLGRAYNLSAPASGRILSGGVDSAALYPPKKFFGAARNIENGGSLTILATALVETGSKMDEVIFEEFKGTGNMELKLDRRLADKRLFPAVDVDASGTRKEELLMSPEELKTVWKLRRVLHALDAMQAIELLMTKLKETHSNYEFLLQVQKTTQSNDYLD